MTSIAPWLSVKNATEALAFYQLAFGAVERERLEGAPGEVIIAQLAIDGAAFWIQDDGDSCPETIDRRSVRMILSVADPDALFARAVAAGARAIVPINEAHGWRVGRIADPSGHHWEIGKRLGR